MNRPTETASPKRKRVPRSASVPRPPAPDHEVVVIGAGFSGIAAGVKLTEAGLDDFVILEKSDGVGGTWRHNSYPGVAVDIPSFTYSFHFEPNPNWSRTFAPGSELLEYAEHCTDKYGIRDRMRFGCEVVEGRFDEAHQFWRLTLADGAEVSGRFLLSCHGVLNTPQTPSIPGLDSFEGRVIETMRWDHSHDLSGERVAVIGTGATAVQLIPAIAEQVGHLDVYQRTPIWVLPKPDPQIPGAAQFALAHIPFLQRSIRYYTTLACELLLVTAGLYHAQVPFLARGAEKLCRRHLRAQVDDPELRAKLTPNYGFGCKRPSASNSYYKTFTRPDVELVTASIDEVLPNGIRTSDGVQREVDTLILATGFKPFDVPYDLYGSDGRTLNQLWAEDRHQAYQGSSVHGFPNMFLSPGPWGATGSSWFFTIDQVMVHAVRVIREARRRGATKVEVTREASDRFEEDSRSKISGAVFVSSSCATSNSYYIDQHGEASYVRPSSGFEAWWAQRTFDLNHYDYDQVTPEPTSAVATEARG